MSIILSDYIRGRSIKEKIIPQGSSLKGTLTHLKEKNWDYEKLTSSYKKTFDCYRLDKVIEKLKIATDAEYVSIIKDNILTLYEDDIGINCIDIYIIAYVLAGEDNIDLNQGVYEFLKENNISESQYTTKKIIRIGKGDGVFLEILDDDGMVADYEFFRKWIYIEDESNNLFSKVVKSYDDYELTQSKFLLFHKVKVGQLDFKDNIQKSIIKKNKKYRNIYSTKSSSVEEISLKYLKKRLDYEFNIKYPNRDKIMKQCFALIEVLGNMSDFTIYRYDFRNFFESVSSKSIYERYIVNSKLKKYEINVVHELVQAYDKCYSGIPTSNALIEIIARDFDLNVEAHLKNKGLILYKRYVDDGIVILNRHINKSEIESILNKSIEDIFKDRNVKLNKEKVCFLTKFDNSNDKINYLGYQFKKITENNGKKVYFKYGIDDNKITKYRNKIRDVVLNYKKNKNIELFRQRIIFLFSRVVFYNKLSHNDNARWDVIGITSNYGELTNFCEDKKLISSTKRFLEKELKNIVESELETNDIPYFLRSKNDKKNIYDNYSLIRNLYNKKSIVFHPNIGWSPIYLKERILRIDKNACVHKKSYRDLVKIYCGLIKL
ncbi:MAG: hypothetical protein E6845_19480 [Clostridium sp.]|uniref:hypothetical protein n=1 Tax=Clostridium TaxID=1485 RepID=UPI0028FF2ED0|nr:hypothetical protein [Clostridium sp.]MDU1605142.1 hypothetical protein [Clostridium sp.]